MEQVTFDNIGPFIIPEEVLAAIKEMKNNKAEGVAVSYTHLTLPTIYSV